MKTAKIILSWMFILAAFGVASEGDYQEAIRQERQYFDMVCSGSWPNYRKIELVCGNYDCTNEQVQKVQKGTNVHFCTIGKTGRNTGKKGYKSTTPYKSGVVLICTLPVLPTQRAIYEVRL